MSGANLQRNWTTIPHLTHFDEADITELESFRQEIATAGAGPDFEVTLLALLMKAAVTALKQFPALNASLDGEDLVLKRYYHLGFTVDTQYGPVVPAIKDVDRKGILELAKELGDLSVRARDKRLEPADIQGGSFTLSSLGAIGGTGFTPIINSPEVATLGVTRSKPGLVEKDGQVVTRIMLPLSLSYDPRVIDGVGAARFTDCLATVLGDLRRATL
jgi:pyruvate dehydrogenase E2 component (dihydrolipoamide acetyltransferase)